MATLFRPAFSAVVQAVYTDTEFKKYTDEVFDNSTCPEGMEVALLCNPFHEKRFSEHLDRYFLPKKDVKVFMDSGGFQLISGKFIGDKNAFKESTYKNMAEWCDYAFCFDENPIDAQRIYYPERVVPAAKETNKNIKRQIEVFKELKTKARIFPIFHCKEKERLQAAKALMEGLDVSYLAGVAFNSMVWGGGNTLDFGKLAFFNEIKRLYKVPNLIHLLSYGEINLVSSLVVLLKEGWLGDDCIFSTDSTSYVLGLSRWGYVPLLDGSAKSISAKNNKKGWEEFQKYFAERCPEMSEESKKIPHTKTHMTHHDSKLAVTCSLLVVKKAYGELVKDPVNYSLKHGYLSESKINSLLELAKTSDYQEFQEWRKEFGEVWNDRHCWRDTMRRDSSLEDFFA